MFLLVFYRKYLKKYPLIRCLAQTAGSLFWRFWAYLPCLKTKCDLSSLGEFCAAHNIAFHPLAEGVLVKTPMLRVFPAVARDVIRSPHEFYAFPEVNVAPLVEATTCGGTNLVYASQTVVHHDQFDFDRDFTYEERLRYIKISPHDKKIMWPMSWVKRPDRVPVAATFTDACGYNYAHWLTEVLPRIHAFCSDPKFKDVPIIINAGLHKNMLESAGVVAGRGRQIIQLPVGKGICAETLYVTSPTGYASFEPRGKKREDHPHGIFNINSLSATREACLAAMPQEFVSQCFKKIYLKRNSAHRNMMNSDEIEKLMISQGFSVVELETLSFLEQVATLYAADVVVGPAGAGFANIMFCRPGAKVFILTQKNKEFSYFYWQNMARPLGIEIVYVLGSGASFHTQSDFSIDPAFVLEALGAEAPAFS